MVRTGSKDERTAKVVVLIWDCFASDEEDAPGFTKWLTDLDLSWKVSCAHVDHVEWWWGSGNTHRYIYIYIYTYSI